MRKQRQFSPSAVDMLEDRVVMSGATVSSAAFQNGFANVFAVPSVSTRTINQALNRIDQAYQSYAGAYRNAFLQATQLARFTGEADAVNRLSNFALNRGVRLSNQLFHAPEGIPFARADISPVLQAIGQSTALGVASLPTLQDARFAGQTIIFPDMEFARQTLVDIVRANVNAGFYTIRR